MASAESNAVCPYCETEIQGVVIREVNALKIGPDEQTSKENVQLILCPSCKKVLASGGNFQSIGNIEILS